MKSSPAHAGELFAARRERRRQLLRNRGKSKVFPRASAQRPQHYAIHHAGQCAVDDHRTGNDEHFGRHAGDEALCLCQVYPKRFFYFPVEIRQEFFFLYYEASSGIHSPIISVRYLLFSPISIRPLSNTRTLSISRLITSGRYSVKA